MTIRPTHAIVILPIGVALLDQLVKWRVVQAIGRGADQHERWLVSDWLGISYGENTGVAFGLLRGTSSWVIAAITIGVLVAIAVYMESRSESAFALIAGTLIIGGALGNLVDRLRLGYVRDFVAVGPWPPFNVADAAISTGVFVVVVATFASERSREASDLISRFEAKSVQTFPDSVE